MKRRQFAVLICVSLLLMANGMFAKEPYRMGTTTAGFLEIGVGAAGISMGDAFVASANDLSAMYWNPAGLAVIETNQALFMYQPWVVDVSTIYAGFGLVFPMLGNIGVGVFGMSYGDIDVTTMEYQNGTGEQYTAYDYAFNLTYARSLAQWFSFGASAKFINSKIWHSTASAFALDLGVLVQTNFFSATGRQDDGLKIGMSIANYGSKMRYDGLDLMFPVDIDQDHDGNYQNLQAKYNMQDWELPLMFRVGIAFDPIVISNQRITLEVDALHPNNMSEFLNVGAQYKFTAPGFGDFFLRGGYKALFMVDSNYGPTFGGGIKMFLAPQKFLNIDYAYRSIGDLGNVHSTSLGLAF